MQGVLRGSVTNVRSVLGVGLVITGMGRLIRKLSAKGKATGA
jgi:hypothetical protein